MNLATKYRPQTFDDVVGQEFTVRILKNELEKKEINHAYLFCGSAGTGKTTIARIFAKELNGSLNDVKEIDAASNNGVDDVRNIIQDASLAPISAPYKVYILDECHMFSNSAWNAMLKLIEEPPKQTIFIFCTTNWKKVPDTIISRTEKFVFKKIPENLIIERLQRIYKTECGKEIKDIRYFKYIARLSHGCLREAIKTLDTLIAASVTTVFKIKDVLDIPDYESYSDLLYAMNLQNAEQVIEIIEKVDSEGNDINKFIKKFLNFVIDCASYKITGKWLSQEFMSDENLLEDIKESYNLDDLTYIMDFLMNFNDKYKMLTDVKTLFIGEVICFANRT